MKRLVEQVAELLNDKYDSKSFTDEYDYKNARKIIELVKRETYKEAAKMIYDQISPSDADDESDHERWLILSIVVCQLEEEAGIHE